MFACVLKDDKFLSLCLLNQERTVEKDVLVGRLPFNPQFGVRFMHGNDIGIDMVRILIGQKKQLIQLVEVTKTYGTMFQLHGGAPDDRAGKQLRARFRTEYYQLNLSQPSISDHEAYDDLILEEEDPFLKMKIICGRLHGGHTAFVATTMGLIRWKFMMDPNATKSADMTDEELKQSMGLSNDFDLLRIYSSQVEVTMSESHAVFYAQENCEFTVIDLETFTKRLQVQIPATNLDNLAIL